MLKKIALTGLLASTLFSVYASSPTLSLSSTGNGDVVSVNVTGDPNTQVVLYYTSTLTSSTQSAVLGTTDINGNFSTTVSTASYNISSSVPVYVMLNGYISPSSTWPYTTPTTVFGLGQSNLTLTTGQSSNVSITGSGSYYVSNNTNSSVASGSISGSTLMISALAQGTNTLTICQNNSSSCLTLTVTVNPTTVTSTATSGMIFNPTITAGQTLSMDITGNTSPYYLSSGANSAFSASISGTTLSIAALAAGQGQVTVCSSNGVCSSFMVTIQAAPSTTTTSPIPTSTKYMFYNPLTYGQTNDEVIELQKRLALEGYFSGSNFSAHFGDKTLASVKAYQRDHGLSPLGNVGPGTRAALNQ